jgi:tRNA modification GTPase
LLAELEAGLDFVEEDIEFVSGEQVVQRLRSAAQLLMETADQLASRHALRTDPRIVILGRPNAGKSSLFNALVKTYGCRTGSDQPHSPAALVSPQRGTTRDYLTATISLGGIQCEVVDTAGIDEVSAHDANAAASSAASGRTDPTTEISAAAKKLAERSGACATLRVYCIEVAMDSAIGEIAITSQATDCDMLVLTKGDLLRSVKQFSRLALSKPLVVTSALLGTGVVELAETLRSILASERTAQHGQAVAATSSRCHASIRLAEDAVNRAIELASDGMGNELIAVELRAALHELGKVVGAVYTDDLLDRIFSKFCIGK